MGHWISEASNCTAWWVFFVFRKLNKRKGNTNRNGVETSASELAALLQVVFFYTFGNDGIWNIALKGLLNSRESRCEKGGEGIKGSSNERSFRLRRIELYISMGKLMRSPAKFVPLSKFRRKGLMMRMLKKMAMSRVAFRGWAELSFLVYY